jgi:eukaryotic-like serine/threonine-protein kinase
VHPLKRLRGLAAVSYRTDLRPWRNRTDPSDSASGGQRPAWFTPLAWGDFGTAALGEPTVNERDLFISAMQIDDSAERAAYLNQACAGDTELRNRLDVLLIAYGRSSSLDELVLHAGETSLPDSDSERTAWSGDRGCIEGPGTIIGPYKLLQKIGEGGMGAVFMAEQEKPVRRVVALKVIKPGMDMGQVIARFEAERQALAIMDHPNIARVLEAGATDTGRPFFVMELVKGVPITEYCDQNHLTPKERLELFIPVCQAIQHAHQKGIIHRDIKPSNVLVALQDGKVVPKVIDFGVAKAIDQRLTERTLCTEFGQIVGTLEYMSPEQAEMGSLDIDTRSDIYSLGVMLYELLTGSTPLQRAKVRSAAYAEILRRIREEEPPKPSTRLSESKDSLPSISAQRKMEPARLTKLVRGELDWIVMKSLEKDRARRYETASAFARDIERYLDGDPVEACPPSASYKFLKFARRYRVALATSGAFAVLLVAATAISSSFAVWANRERIRAEKAEEAAKADQARAYESEQTAIDAVKRYGDVVSETPDLKDDPRLAALRTTLLKEPQIFFRNLRDRLLADRQTTPRSLTRLAAASVELGMLTSEIGDRRDAQRALEVSLAMNERLAREHPTVAVFQRAVAAIHINIGGLQKETGRPAEAMASFEQARAILEQLTSENPSVTEFQSILAKAHNCIGLLEREAGQPAESLASHERARAIWERLANQDSSATELHKDLAASYNAIGLVQAQTGQPALAIESHERARAIQERLARDNPSATQFQRDLAATEYNIGRVQIEIGRPAEALKSHEQARAIRERLASTNPTVTDFQRDLAQSYYGIGAVHTGTGRPTEALKSYEQARAIHERLVRAHPSVTGLQSDLAASHNSIGHVQSQTGRLAEALVSFEHARAIWERLARDVPSVISFQSDLASSQNNIGLAQNRMGRPVQALASFQQARAIWERLARDNPSITKFQHSLATVDNSIGMLENAAGRPKEALASHKRARAIWERLASDNPKVAELQHSLAMTNASIAALELAAGRLAEARLSYERARAIRERLVHEHPESSDFASFLGGTLHNMAVIDLREQQDAKAWSTLQEAIAWQRKALAVNPEHPQYRQFLDNHLKELIRAAERLGRPADADQARRELSELRSSDPRVVALDARLTAVLQGKQAPNDDAERLQLGYRAYEKKLYASSARLYTQALANSPKLAEDRQAGHAYNAACVATLAGCGQGQEDPAPDDAAKAKLRRQALVWLEAELAACSKVLDGGPPGRRATVVSTLKHWKADADLAGVRDEKGLAKLSADERSAFEQLWKYVDQLLSKAAAAASDRTDRTDRSDRSDAASGGRRTARAVP